MTIFTRYCFTGFFALMAATQSVSAFTIRAPVRDCSLTGSSGRYGVREWVTISGSSPRYDTEVAFGQHSFFLPGRMKHWAASCGVVLLVGGVFAHWRIRSQR
jgi:hypothetical protein